jgi:pyrroline-5-carboxylate reductase
MKLCILGAGKMARALVGGMLKAGILQPGEITGIARSEESKAAFLALAPGLGWELPSRSALRGATHVLFGIKPAQFPDLLPALGPWPEDACYLSIAAGLCLEKIGLLLGGAGRHRILRAMPNTPCMLGAGVTGFCGNACATPSDLAFAGKAFGSVGLALQLPEDQFDALTALSGSGPAYYYEFTRCLADAAARLGMAPETARQLARATALGAARMMAETGQNEEALIAQVKSKGGTTEAALNNFNDNNLQEITQNALSAAYNRSKELRSRPEMT